MLRAHVRMWLYFSRKKSPENKVGHKCWHWLGGPGRCQMNSDGGAVVGQRTEISLVKEKRETVLLYFSFSMFGFGRLQLNFPAFPTLLMPRNLLFL